MDWKIITSEKSQADENGLGKMEYILHIPHTRTHSGVSLPIYFICKKVYVMHLPFFFFVVSVCSVVCVGSSFAHAGSSFLR